MALHRWRSGYWILSRPIESAVRGGNRLRPEFRATAQTPLWAGSPYTPWPSHAETSTVIRIAS